MRRFSAKHIDFRYDEKIILRKASLEVIEGSIVGILGPRNSGKTTFSDIACKLKKASSGNIENDFPDFTYLPQMITTPPPLWMHDIFKMIIALSSDEDMTRSRALERLHNWCPPAIDRYKDIWNKTSSACSHGEIRWFFTLSLLAASNDFIILDEPTTGVDPELHHCIWQCLQGAAKEGAAILVSSHNVDEVVAHCSYFYMISQQRFNRFSSGSDFMQKYRAKTADEAFIHAITESACVQSGQ